MKKLLALILNILFLTASLTSISCAPQQTLPKITIENDVPLIGYGVGTTGGTEGEVVVVDEFPEFAEAIKDDNPRIILVSGEISYTISYYPQYLDILHVGSNKTILGLGEGATINKISLRIGSSSGSKSNIIIRNITFDNAPDDNITIWYTSTLVWIDHCTFRRAADSNVDITRQSDFITLSWNKFEHEEGDAKGVSIVGSDDAHIADAEHLRVTYHHNWFNGTQGRNPRVRYGHIHIFNNYYSNITMGIVSTTYARTLIEKNYFYMVATPTSITAGTSPEGYIRLVDNIFDNCGEPIENKPENVPDAPYSYNPDPPENVPEIVQNKAGAGKIIVKYE